MDFNTDPRINVNISERCFNWLDFNKTYNIVKLKPNKQGTKNVLTYLMVSEPNTKYIIIYNFDLDGETILLPKNVIIEVDGGKLSNGTIVGNYSILLNPNGVNILENVTLGGTWREDANFADNDDAIIDSNNHVVLADKLYEPDKWSGLGKIYVKKNMIFTADLEDNHFYWYEPEGSDCGEFKYLLYSRNNVCYYIADECGTGVVLDSLTNKVKISNEYNIDDLPEYAKGNRLNFNRSTTTGEIFIYWIDGTLLTTSEFLNNLMQLSATHMLSALPVNVDYVYSNVLDPAVFKYPYTTYVIRYDFNLCDRVINLPEGCTIELDGGNILNGTINAYPSPTDHAETSKIAFNGILLDAELAGDWIYIDYHHKVITEAEFDRIGDNKRKDTIYFIVEE